MTTLLITQTVLLIASLVVNAILFIHRRNRGIQVEELTREMGFRDMLAQGSIRALRGMLSRPWIDRHGRYLRSLRRPVHNASGS